MKRHPGKEILQDYFEDLLGEEVSHKVKQHLEDCDQCSALLASFAMADEAFKKSSLAAPAGLEEKTFHSVQALLSKRRERARSAQDKMNRAKEREERVKEWAIGMKDFFTHEAKAPALQVAGLSLFVAILIQVQRYEKKTIHFNLIDNSVQSFERID